MEGPVGRGRRQRAFEEATLVAAVTAAAEAGLAVNKTRADKIYRFLLSTVAICGSFCAVILSIYMAIYSKTLGDSYYWPLLLLTVAIMVPSVAGVIVLEERRMDSDIVAMAVRKTLEDADP